MAMMTRATAPKTAERMSRFIAAAPRLKTSTLPLREDRENLCTKRSEVERFSRGGVLGAGLGHRPLPEKFLLARSARALHFSTLPQGEGGNEGAVCALLT